jgi:tetratricopeptide (TPR) repeat protein
MGIQRCLDRLRELEAEPLHAAQLMLVRHLYFAWQGDLAEADRCKRRAEVLQVQSSSHQTFEGQHLFSELQAFALAGDLTSVKRTADAIDARTGIHPAWRPMLHYARGEYQRIRGDFEAALEELETALSLGNPGEHPVWASLAGAHVRVLVELGRYEEAAARAQQYLHDAERAELGYGRTYVMMPYSVALAHLGRHEEARSLASAVVATFADLGTTGLNLAVAHETQARIALLAEDRAAFELAKQLATQSWPGAEKRLARSLYPSGDDASADGSSELVDERAILTQLSSELDSCLSSAERAQCGLRFLMLQSGAIGALLYACSAEGLTYVACGGTAVRSDALDSLAAAYFEEQFDRDEVTEEGELESGLSELETERGREELKTVLLMHQTSGAPCMSGVAVLIVPSGRAYSHPARIAVELSRYLVERGDASPQRA